MNQIASSRTPLDRIGDAPISSHMTSSPACIGAHRSLADAWQTMLHEHVRHLPVLQGGQVVGMVSQRDLGLLGAPRAQERLDMRVEEAMSSDPYVVGPSTALRVVIEEMNVRRIGSAIVADGGSVIGVFTTTDAIALLSRLLESSAVGA
jgi:acetoin utilization protein AcuB